MHAAVQLVDLDCPRNQNLEVLWQILTTGSKRESNSGKFSNQEII